MQKVIEGGQKAAFLKMWLGKAVVSLYVELAQWN